MTYDLRQAQRLVDSIPEIKESIPYLTELAEGSNPEIPGYLALGKLMQINALAEGAGAAKPPQGTVKDKLTRTGGVMALMNGRGQQASQNMASQSMAQPGPVPQNIPQPEVQDEAMPEDVTMAAEGGIMQAEIDPNMFRFDGGGIVAFANDLDKKKQQVKDKEKDDEKSSTVGKFLRELLAPLSNTARDVYTAGQAFGTSPGLFEQLTESERAAKEQAAEEIRNPNIRAVTDSYLRPDQTVRNNEQNRLRASYNQQYREGNTANSPYEGKPLISPEMQQMMAAQGQPPAQPAQPPKPTGGITNVAPGANINIGATKPQPMPENEFLTATKNFINQKPEAFDETAEAAKLKARNEAAGIGTYAKVMRDQQAKMREQFDASRPTMNEDIVGALRRYARPGAMAGDVGDEITSQSRREREARMQFEQDQFKVTEAVERLEEARRTNDVGAITKAEADLKKANIDLRNHQMTAAASAASTVSADQRSAADRAQNLEIEKAKLAIKKAELAQGAKDSETMKLMKEVEALEAAGKFEEAVQKIERYGKLKAAGLGVRYTGTTKSTTPTPKEINDAIEKAYKTRNSMDFLILGNKNAKQADKDKAQANIDRTKADVIKGLTGGIASEGGGSMSPQDKQALEWANANPNDPRSAQIKQKLGA
jgi:hypothetical protein